jgi:DNA-binding PadR family transcriptional regulator
MLYGHLHSIVLHALAERPRSGYQLMKHIQERTGIKPSTGSIYPLLDALRQKGLLTVKDVGRKRVYSITHSGRAELHQHPVEGMYDRIMEEWRIAQAATQKDAGAADAFRRIRSAGVFKSLEPELNELNKQLILAIARGVDPKTMKSIMADGARRLRKVKAWH